MFKNYLKLALRVLRRRKVFTAISLFGISFTLAILMLVVSVLESELGSNSPLSDRDKMIFLDRIVQKNMQPDTTMLLDSSLVAGVMKYDTTYTIGELNRGTSISSFNLRFLQNHLSDIDGVEGYSFYSSLEQMNSFVEDSKIEMQIRHTDVQFWELFDFEFLEGSPYNSEQYEAEEEVVVINDELAQQYFGRTRNVIGQEIEYGGKPHKIIGVVPKTQQVTLHANVYSPSSTMNGYPGDRDRYSGAFTAVYLANSKKKRAQIQEQLTHTATLIPSPANSNFNKFMLIGKTSNELYADQFMYSEEPANAARKIFGAFAALLLLFTLLPTLNLVNLNVSRMLDRSSEIGVRKAFGALRSDIIGQFVFENIVLTIIGGVIGFLFALLLMHLVNQAQILGGLILKVNLKFFLYCIALVLFFGVLSGLLPAYRISKLHIVNALKQSQS